MKLSDNTLNILKNFSSINNSILVKPGNVLRTISPHNNIFAEATVEEDFPTQFALYNLVEFINVERLFDSPELFFKNNSVEIVKDNRVVNYIYADPTLVIAPPDKKIKVVEPVVKFDLSNVQLKELLDASSIMSFPDLNVVSNGEGVKLVVKNNQNDVSSSYALDVDKPSNSVYNLHLKIENLKLITGDYSAAITKSFAHFVSKNTNLQYWVGLESTSTFE